MPPAVALTGPGQLVGCEIVQEGHGQTLPQEDLHQLGGHVLPALPRGHLLQDGQGRASGGLWGGQGGHSEVPVLGWSSLPPRVPPLHSTHLARAEDGLSEELDEGLVVGGGQDPVFHQPHRQPQGAQLPPAMTWGGLGSRTHRPPSPQLLPSWDGGATLCCPGHSYPGELPRQGAGSCLAPLPALTHGPRWCLGRAGAGTSPWWGLCR